MPTRSSGARLPCQRNDFDEAERLLREAVRVVPGNPVALHKLALCVKEQARFAEAETLLRRFERRFLHPLPVTSLRANAPRHIFG
jgi:Flp pilus assembly protein TadD